jgi:hypothetical protein
MHLAEPVVTALISAAGVIIVGLITVWTARLARRSAQATQQVEERAKVVEGYDKLNTDLEKRNEILSASVDKLTLRIAECEDKQRSDRLRITELENEKLDHRRQFRLLFDYTNRLVDIMRKAELDVPTIPNEIVRYYEGGL